jgi:hypothetical protein
MPMEGLIGGSTKYIYTRTYRVSECLFPRPNCDPHAPLHPQASGFPPGTKGRGGHTRLRVTGGGGPNSDDWRKSLSLCLLCDRVRRSL